MKRKVALVVVTIWFIAGPALNSIIIPVQWDDPLSVAAELMVMFPLPAVAFFLWRSIRKGPVTFPGWRAFSASLLKGFAAIWVGLFALLLLLSSVGIFLSASDFWQGVAAWQHAFDPRNVFNVILTIVLLAPAGLAFMLAHTIEPSVPQGRPE